MSLKEKIQTDIKTAMKARNKEELEVLRMTWSQIRRGEIDSRKDFTDDDVLKILKTGVKSREESVTMFKRGGRDELAQKESFEITVLKKYLPEQFSIEKIEEIVENIITEKGLAEPKDMGVIMKCVMNEYGAQVDGKIVQEVARLKLRNK